MSTSLRLRQTLRLLAAVTATLVGGTLGFHLLLDESWFQSFYRSVVTATLAGLDTVPRSDGARALSILLVMAGLTIIAYAGAVIVEVIAGGVLTGVLAERRRERTIERLRDHFIICGYGRVGRRVAEEFRVSGEPYVVLDFREDSVAAAKEHGELLIDGNATEDEDLRRAGIDRAKGLVAASDSDADNLYIALSARAVRPDIQIVARASDEDAEKKLKLAGADRVVLPYATAGRTMANLVLKPQVTAFLDAVTTATGPDLHLAEIEMPETCPHAGKTIRDVRVRHETGAIIVALRKKDGTFDTTPEPDVRIDPGDVLVGVGTAEELRRLEDLFAPAGPDGR
ncbi:MAG: voltage-gated potassium channel [Gaiellaceae bacterium]|nr:voltage-gated potassium channel [Gaiellaceae bacterium]MDX6469632.1 voltage-gated potassium channel [Gaiellaceae bacterium]MDX6473132.1 voltage-gated potassium channel [Gaiellaceae bacterium]